MGGNMRTRLRNAGIQVTGYDRNPEVSDVGSLTELVSAIDAPRIVWIMVPAGDVTTSVVTELSGLLGSGDLIIDGGNSRFTEDAKHAAIVAPRGIDYMDRSEERRVGKEGTSSVSRR